MFPSKTIVILISGKAGVGKTTFAGLVEKELESKGYMYQRIPFAMSVKGIAKAMGWDGQKDDKGRHLLQSLGVVGRTYDPNMWINMSYSTMNSGIKFVTTDDWRFPNEVEVLKARPDLEVFTVRIEAPHRESLRGTPRYDDISENSLPSAFSRESDVYDFEVGNYGTMDELNVSAQSVVQFILDSCKKW